MNSTCRLLGVAALLLAAPPLAGADDGKSGNPVFPSHYANPEGTDPNARVTCIDRMEFAADGTVKPIRITRHGVPAHPLP